MTDEDKMIQLAFSIYSNPGVYVLLIGSGVSRAAGIPTGWEIMLDLIRKIGAVSGEKEIENPEKWYWDKYEEEPTYSNLVKRLARTREEQRGILREYFEPNEEEREAGEKQPTKAHKAIAKLVKEGYIKLILTTNFDRLIEKALEEEGVNNYQILSTKNKIKGKAPYIHRVTIIKLHGDYIDGEMKNTPEELSEYSKEKNKLLDKIFDDFGLIVCGWSAIYDDALRNALYRRKNRRYSIYWTVRSELSPEAKELVEFQEANLITIENADTFYEELSNKIEALKEYNKPHPLSSVIAFEETKKYLSEEKYDIKLENLLMDEIEKVSIDLKQNFWKLTNEHNVEEKLSYCVEKLQTLMRINSLIGYFGADRHKYLLKKIAEQFIVDGNRGTIHYADYFPPLFFLYVLGISALVKEKYRSLATILLKTRLKARETKPLITEIYIDNDLNRFIEHFFKEKYRRHHTPANNYIFDSLKDVFKQIISRESEYECIFDLFEYIFALSYLWFTVDDIDNNSSVWAPYGRFVWRYSDDYKTSCIGDFVKEGESKGNNWEFLKAGFFNGSIEDFKRYNKKYKEFLSKIRIGF